MTGRERHQRLLAAAALLAVALFAFATAKSAVMRAEAATWWGSAPICAVHGAEGDAGHGLQAACAFCAAAAHSPIQALPQPLHCPAWISWAPAGVASPAPLRRPPPVPPRARGPPPSV